MKEKNFNQYKWSMPEKEINKLRSEGIEISTNEEYYVVHVQDKDRFIPRSEHVVVGSKNVPIYKLIRALAIYPELEPQEALERLDRENNI